MAQDYPRWTLHEGRNLHYADKIEGLDPEATTQRCYYIAGPEHASDFVADIIVRRGEWGDAVAQMAADIPRTNAIVRRAMLQCQAEAAVEREHGREDVAKRFDYIVDILSPAHQRDDRAFRTSHSYEMG